MEQFCDLEELFLPCAGDGSCEKAFAGLFCAKRIAGVLTVKNRRVVENRNDSAFEVDAKGDPFVVHGSARRHRECCQFCGAVEHHRATGDHVAHTN